MIAFSFGFIVILAVLLLTIAIIILNVKKIAKINEDKNNTSIFMRNIFINIGLTIFSGIIYLFCVKLFNNLYADREPSLFSGIIIMLEIWFFNISGIISSSMNIKKIKSILIIYGLFIVLTISIYNLTNIIMPMFQNFWLIIAIGIIIIENIFSYLIVKIIIRIKNGIRCNVA